MALSERTKLPWAHNTLFFMCLTSVNINQCTSSAISYNNIHFFFRNHVFFAKKKAYAGSFAFLFQFEEIAAESHRILVEAYGDNALSETTCRDWFRRFNDDNFDLSDKKRENRPRKIEDYQLQALLDENDTQSQKMLAEQLGVSQAAISMRLHSMGKVQKIGKWVPHELNDRQMKRRQNTCQILLVRQKRKSFLHRIVTGDEK